MRKGGKAGRDRLRPRCYTTSAQETDQPTGGKTGPFGGKCFPLRPHVSPEPEPSTPSEVTSAPYALVTTQPSLLTGSLIKLQTAKHRADASGADPFRALSPLLIDKQLAAPLLGSGSTFHPWGGERICQLVLQMLTRHPSQELPHVTVTLPRLHSGGPPPRDANRSLLFIITHNANFGALTAPCMF